jgi:predicted nucleic acid-binding protein
MMASDQELVTTNYVLIETFALIQSRLRLEAVREFQEDIVPVLRIEFVTPEMHRLGIAALLAASRRGFSLVDCVSFEVMRELGMKSAFTFDGHFREYGFTAIP